MRLDQQQDGPATAAGRLAEEIAVRHELAGDEHMEALSLDALGAVAYVCSRRGGVSPAVVCQDVADGLRIVGLLRTLLDRQELALLEMGRKHRVPWSALAKVLGLGSRQAAQQHKLRLEESLETSMASGGRSEVAARRRRRSAETEPGWIVRHSEAISSVARNLSALTFQSPVAADDAIELAEALDDPETSTRHLLTVVSQVIRSLAREGDEPASGSQVVRQAADLLAEWEPLRPPA